MTGIEMAREFLSELIQVVRDAALDGCAEMLIAAQSLWFLTELQTGSEGLLARMEEDRRGRIVTIRWIRK